MREFRPEGLIIRLLGDGEVPVRQVFPVPAPAAVEGTVGPIGLDHDPVVALFQLHWKDVVIGRDGAIIITHPDLQEGIDRFAVAGEGEEGAADAEPCGPCLVAADGGAEDGAVPARGRCRSEISPSIGEPDLLRQDLFSGRKGQSAVFREELLNNLEASGRVEVALPLFRDGGKKRQNGGAEKSGQQFFHVFLRGCFRAWK